MVPVWLKADTGAIIKNGGQKTGAVIQNIGEYADSGCMAEQHLGIALGKGALP